LGKHLISDNVCRPLSGLAWRHLSEWHGAALCRRRRLSGDERRHADPRFLAACGGRGFADYTFFDGTIDEIRISDVVRYPSSFVPSGVPFSADANTLGLYHFDEGAGQATRTKIPYFPPSANDARPGNSGSADSADSTLDS
jgi:hypothetical protein